MTETSSSGDIPAFHQFMNATSNRYGDCSHDLALVTPSEFRKFGWREGEIVVISAASIKAENSRAEKEEEGVESGRGGRGELSGNLSGDTQPKVCICIYTQPH